MQTFLPHASFTYSVLALDKKRQWKQVVEASQIINCLEGTKTGWKNHPAVKMWDGYIPALKAYFNTFLRIAKDKHCINTTMVPFDSPNEEVTIFLPWWYGNSKFHRAMRARLIEKDRAFYLPLFPEDEGYNGGRYWWPNMETKTFYTI